MRRWTGLAFLWVASTLLLGAVAAAQSYPVRPIRLVLTFPPGGSADILARALQPRVEELLGQRLVIENRPGAGGNIGLNVVAKAEPDGYTIGVGAAGALSVNPSLYDKMPFDPAHDFAPITMIAEIPFVLAVPSTSPVHNLREFIALGKAKPDELSIGHGGIGTAMHLTAALLNQMAGLSLPFVSYKGSGPAATDAAGDHVPAAVIDIPSALTLTADGRLQLLAVSASKRTSFLPDVPTMSEAGIPGYESVGWFGLVAPAGTPPAIVKTLNEAFVNATKDPAMVARFRLVGVEPTTGSPAAFEAFIASERTKWAKIVAETRIKPE